MERIAILNSTSPLRKTTTRGGVTKQRMDLQACVELAERFDVIILGSLAHDQVFEYLTRHLPRDVRSKFRLYSRAFFHSFHTPETLNAADDPRNVGWQRILSENSIQFEVLRSRLGPDNRYRQERFNWHELETFITDPRVTLVTGGEGQLFYERPTTAKR